LFRIQDVRIPLLCGLLAGTAMYSAMTFIPMFIQGVTGSTATQAGFALTPFLLGWVFMSVISGRLALRMSLRVLGVSGFGLLTVAYVFLSLFGTDTPRSLIYANMILMGIGMGAAMLILLLLIQTSVPIEHLGIATSLNVFFRSIGGAVGVAVLGALLTASFLTLLSANPLAADITDINAVLDPAARLSMAPSEITTLEDALAISLRRVFVAGSIIAALATLAAFWLPSSNLRTIEANLKRQTSEV
jgi:predicted MFS family arabinose efflux permease